LDFSLKGKKKEKERERAATNAKTRTAVGVRRAVFLILTLQGANRKVAKKIFFKKEETRRRDKLRRRVFSFKRLLNSVRRAVGR